MQACNCAMTQILRNESWIYETPFCALICIVLIRNLKVCYLILCYMYHIFPFITRGLSGNLYQNHSWCRLYGDAGHLWSFFLSESTMFNSIQVKKRNKLVLKMQRISQYFVTFVLGTSCIHKLAIQDGCHNMLSMLLSHMTI